MLRLFKNSATLGIGALLERGLQVLLLPAYTRYLSPDDFGVLSVLAALSLVLGTLCMAGLTNGIFRYFFYAEKEGSSKEVVVWSGFMFVGLASLLSAVAMVVFSQQIAHWLFGAARYWYVVDLTALQLLVSSAAAIARTLLLLDEKMQLINAWNLIQAGLTGGLGVWLVAFAGRGLDGAVEARVFATALPTFLILFYTLSKFAFRFQWAMLVTLLKFSVPLVGTVFAFWFLDSSDRYVMNRYLPLSEVGLYDMGYRVAMLIMLAIEGFTSAWPAYYHRHGRGQEICNDVLRATLLLSCTLVILLSATAPLVVRLLTEQRFHESHNIVPWVAAAYMLKVPYLVFIMGIHLKNKVPWLVAIEIIAAAVNIGANLIFIPMFGREAAAATTLLAYAVMAVLTLLLVQKVNPIPNLSGRSHITILAVTFAVLAAYVAAMKHGVSPWLSGVGLVLAFASGVLLFYGPREIKESLAAVLAQPKVAEPSGPA